ncbi:MAG: tetratricopeptide repeat protein [Terrimicrobiaceae bacterium]|nr:hypothetical protein [Terrimicrobiaceae bacterium]
MNTSNAIIVAIILAQPFAYGEESDIRISLIKTQNELRTLVAKREGHPPSRDYYSSALETTDPSLLEAHREFERGVVFLLQNQPSEAREHWKASLRLLESGDEEGKRWLRRANAAVVQREIIDLHQKGDAALVARLVGEAKGVVDRNSLPASGSIPTRQSMVEHWLFSSEIMFRFANWLADDGPKDVQLAGAKRALEEICRHRLLTEKMISGQRNTDHEAMIDHVVFEKGMTASFVSLFYNVRLAGKRLPPSTRATWTALLATWATEATDEHLVSNAWDEGVLPKPFQAERFQVLSALTTVLNRFEFPDSARKLAKGVATLDATACPPDETVLAGLLIDGTQLEAASAFLDAAEAGGTSDKTRLLRIRLLYAQGRNAEAASKASELISRSGPPESHFWHGKALLALDKQAEARKAFRDFVSRSPESRLAPEACLLSAMLSSNLHEPRLASTYYEETMARYPNSKEARRASELLEE